MKAAKEYMADMKARAEKGAESIKNFSRDLDLGKKMDRDSQREEELRSWMKACLPGVIARHPGSLPFDQTAIKEMISEARRMGVEIMMSFNAGKKARK